VFAIRLIFQGLTQKPKAPKLGAKTCPIDGHNECK
jgi:hypothetical protein